MRILGIDPGLATTGIGIVEAQDDGSLQPIEWMALTTPAGLPLAVRLAEIQSDLQGLLDESLFDLAVVEKIYFATNITTGIDVSHARGVVLATLQQVSVPILEPTPMQLKNAITGDGGADKKQMQDMIVRMLRLDRIPQPDDAADALGLAIYGALSQSSTIPIG